MAEAEAKESVSAKAIAAIYDVYGRKKQRVIKGLIDNHDNQNSEAIPIQFP